MADRIHKNERVARLHVYLFCADNSVGRPAESDAMRFVFRGRKVGLVAAGDHHGAPIARADVGERHQHIDLAVHKVPVVIPELVALTAVMAARMDADRLAGSAQVGKVLVDEEGAVVKIEGAFAADKEFDLLDPGRMIDQIFESGAGFIGLLQIEAIGGFPYWWP